MAIMGYEPLTNLDAPQSDIQNVIQIVTIRNLAQPPNFWG